MHGARAARLAAQQQQRRHERALLGVGALDLERAGIAATRSASRRSSATRASTSPRCARLASGPMRTPSRARIADDDLRELRLQRRDHVGRSAAGTIALRMAVHFCPALTVISRATSRTKRSNSGVPGAASGPRMQEFSESVSAVKRTECAITAGCVRSLAAVLAEPVNATASWQSR